ncbi:MAG: hypothetical protein WD407_07980 [Rhodospirillales bacterium]
MGLKLKCVWAKLFPLWVLTLATACATEPEIVRTGFEAPRYCYSEFVGRDAVTCYLTPRFGEENRLVGYTGPAPYRYPRPAPPPPATLYAPDPVNYWVKDAELISQAAPVPPGRTVAPPPEAALT